MDPHDDADMEAFQRVYEAAERAEDEAAALYSRADAVAMLTSSGTGGQLTEGYGAFVAGDLVGELMITGAMHDNVQVARVWIWVDPAHQRRGVGNRAFAESVGYRLATTEVERRLAVVAFATAVVSNEYHQHVHQWGTMVDPAHRGRRLGMAVKCAQLRALGDHFPDKRYIETTNAETNNHMVAINEALGFEVTAVRGAFQKRL